MRVQQRRAALRDPEVEEADRWRREGLDYLRADVDRLPAVVSARLGRTLGVYRAFPPVAEGRDEGVQAIGSVVWLVALVPLAVVGAVLLARRRPLHLALVGAPMVSSLVVTVVGFGMLRFRHPMELMAVVLAGVRARNCARSVAREPWLVWLASARMGTLSVVIRRRCSSWLLPGHRSITGRFGGHPALSTGIGPNLTGSSGLGKARPLKSRIPNFSKGI